MMKQSDIAVIVVIGATSLIISYFAAASIIKTPQERNIQVERVNPITPNFPEVDKKIFDEDSINPTVQIDIDPDSGNPDPFEQTD